MDYTFVNPGPNYLSTGEQALPTLLLVFTLLFLTATVAWTVQLFRLRDRVSATWACSPTLCTSPCVWSDSCVTVVCMW